VTIEPHRVVVLVVGNQTTRDALVRMFFQSTQQFGDLCGHGAPSGVQLQLPSDSIDTEQVVALTVPEPHRYRRPFGGGRGVLTTRTPEDASQLVGLDFRVHVSQTVIVGYRIGFRRSRLRRRPSSRNPSKERLNPAYGVAQGGL